MEVGAANSSLSLLAAVATEMNETATIERNGAGQKTKDLVEPTEKQVNCANYIAYKLNTKMQIVVIDITKTIDANDDRLPLLAALVTKMMQQLNLEGGQQPDWDTVLQHNGSLTLSRLISMLNNNNHLKDEFEKAMNSGARQVQNNLKRLDITKLDFPQETSMNSHSGGMESSNEDHLFTAQERAAGQL